MLDARKIDRKLKEEEINTLKPKLVFIIVVINQSVPKREHNTSPLQTSTG
jgi:hypothetical protein